MKEVHVAYSIADTPYPSMTFKGAVEPVPYEVLSVSEGIFPIAETSTLPQEYYANSRLDIRYPSDRRRTEVIDSAHALEEVPYHVRRLLGSVATEALDPWQKSVPVEDIVDCYNVHDQADFLALTTLFLQAPAELRAIAYQEPGSAIEVIAVLGSIQDLYDIADISEITVLLRDVVGESVGQERVSRVKQARNVIEAKLAEQRTREDAIVLSGTEEGLRLQEARVSRKRFVADGIDGTLFRLATNSGIIVDPTYLVDDTHYEALRNEPEVSFDYKVAFLKHMMAGHWALGQDHTFVYRNSGERMAAAQTGVVPDYAAVRPGNFLFHDLKLLEHGPFKKDFPTQVLYEYVRNHYLRQMDLAVLDADGEPGSNATVNQYFIHGGIRYIVPLERNQKHIIPFRALKKHDNDPQYYEYGQECYMAELVDIALQLDAIGQYMGSEESKAVLGDVSIGKHAWDLIFDLYYSAEGSLAMAALAIEQILFMKGRIAAGGRQSIEATLSNRKEGADLLSILATIESVQELTSTGVPQTSRPPLTCYYEWFQKHARPISSEEIRRRGVAVVDSVFK